MDRSRSIAPALGALSAIVNDAPEPTASGTHSEGEQRTPKSSRLFAPSGGFGHFLAPFLGPVGVALDGEELFSGLGGQL